MKIVMLATDAHGGFGGIAQYNRDILAAFDRLKCVEKVDVLPRTIAASLDGVPAKVTYHRDSAKGTAAYVRACLVAGLRKERVDLVYCAHLNLLPLAKLVAWMKRAPLLLAIYGIDAWQPPAQRLRRMAARTPDMIVSISQITLDRFRAWSGSDASSAILPNQIDSDYLRPGPRNPAMEERYGIVGRKSLLTFGRMSADERYKGFDEIIELLPRLRTHHPDLAYLAAGDGSDRDRLEAKAREMGVADMVVFTGRVDEEEKAELYRLADAYVMPSSGEGFGFVVLEALACGIPVVASNADGTREAVLDGKLGIVVDPDDPDALERAVLEVLQKPKGVPPGLAHFSPVQFTERLRQAVSQLTNG